MEHQHVHRVRISRFMGVEEIDVYGAEVNEIAGKCASAKTSALMAIEAAFVGAKAVPSRPVKAGYAEAEVRLETDDLEFLLICQTDRKSKWVCRRKGGGVCSHAEIEAITSKLWFDPTRWAAKSKTEMYEDLIALAPSDWVVEFKRHRQVVADAETDRLLAGREVRALGDPPVEPERVEPIDVGAAAAELEKVHEHNQEQERRERRHKALGDRIAWLNTEIERLQTELKAKQAELQEVPVVEPRRDPEPHRQKIAEAKAVNAKAAEHDRWKRATTDYWAKAERHHEAERKVRDARKARDAHVSGLELPVAGLKIDGEGGIFYNELPCPEHVNQGALILISAELAMAQNATLRVMFLHHGEALDDQVFQDLVQLGRRHRVQTWIATTDRTGQGHGAAIHLEDGRVVEDQR